MLFSIVLLINTLSNCRKKVRLISDLKAIVVSSHPLSPIPEIITDIENKNDSISYTACEP